MPYLLTIVMVLLAKKPRTVWKRSWVWPEGSLVTWIVTQLCGNDGLGMSGYTVGWR
jgi:hypothetical protein